MTALPGPGIVLSGTILEVLPDGTRRPIGARQVAIEVDVNSPTDPNRGGWVQVDAQGRYRLSGVPDERFVKITSVDFGAVRDVPAYRFCATNTVTRGDSVLDFPIFLPGARVPTPTLSGQVFTVTDGSRVPVVGQTVYYKSKAFGPDVWGRTDNDGGYSLCGVPALPGSLYMFWSNDEILFSQPVEIRSDQVIDIDATKFATCL